MFHLFRKEKYCGLFVLIYVCGILYIPSRHAGCILTSSVGLVIDIKLLVSVHLPVLDAALGGMRFVMQLYFS